MAAQESERKFQICPRCFASVKNGEPFCPECGAPFGDSRPKDGLETPAEAELARANLLRMRGEYKQAEEQCLNILKRFPNEASANILLGDVSAEQGDLTQAISWYELSLDLVPDDQNLAKKLESVRERVRISETAKTAKQLGLPEAGPRKIKFIVGFGVPILVVAIAAYLIGAKAAQGDSTLKTQVTTPVRAPVDNAPSNADPTLAPVSAGGGELMLLRELVAVSAYGPEVLSVMQDPRSKAITINFEADSDDFRTIAARLSRNMLDVEPDALNVTVRGMRNGVLIYTADVLRSRVNETNSPEWQERNQNEPAAWIDYVLTNEWSSARAKSDDASSGDSQTKAKQDVGSDGAPVESPKLLPPASDAPTQDKAEPPAGKGDEGGTAGDSSSPSSGSPAPSGG